MASDVFPGYWDRRGNGGWVGALLGECLSGGIRTVSGDFRGGQRKGGWVTNKENPPLSAYRFDGRKGKRVRIFYRLSAIAVIVGRRCRWTRLMFRFFGLFRRFRWSSWRGCWCLFVVRRARMSGRYGHARCDDQRCRNHAQAGEKGVFHGGLGFIQIYVFRFKVLYRIRKLCIIRSMGLWYICRGRCPLAELVSWEIVDSDHEEVRCDACQSVVDTAVGMVYPLLIGVRSVNPNPGGGWVHQSGPVRIGVYGWG